MLQILGKRVFWALVAFFIAQVLFVFAADDFVQAAFGQLYTTDLQLSPELSFSFLGGFLNLIWILVTDFNGHVHPTGFGGPTYWRSLWTEISAAAQVAGGGWLILMVFYLYQLYKALNETWVELWQRRRVEQLSTQLVRKQYAMAQQANQNEMTSSTNHREESPTSTGMKPDGATLVARRQHPITAAVQRRTRT